MDENYNPQKIEAKWRKFWEKNKIFQVDLKLAKKPYYNLMMFPYPSAEGLHVGNVYAFTGSDIHGRFRRMQGYNVFEPIGFDAFGIHSENFAIKKGIHPKVLIKKSVNHFREQLKSLGCLFDWKHEVDTTQPDYYKWTQWIFLQLFKAGLAYRKKAPVDWCPSCKTVLADEQVISGKCERCGSEVVQKETEQWFFKITKYAEKLLKNLEKIDWSERTKVAQKNWIGRSEDAEIVFSLKDIGVKIPIITTRPDTVFGATFLVMAPENELIDKLKSKIKNQEEVENYRTKARQKSEFERGFGIREKTGVLLEGIIAVNPVNNKEIPVYIADFVLGTYGTGAVMGVPAHDDRDFAFAKKFRIPIISVVEKLEKENIIRVYVYDNDNSDAAQKLRNLGTPREYWTPTQREYEIATQNKNNVIEILENAHVGTKEQYQIILKGKSFSLEVNPSSIDFGFVYSGDGIHINSEFLDGFYKEDAINKIREWLSARKIGGKSVHYHLRDWLISRQRYWGPPIPVVYCKKCGVMPVEEKNLPVLLPFAKNFRPEGTGKSPLASVKKFVKTKCPNCKGPAERETDVSDTFLDSAWYYLRYPSVGEKSSVLEIGNWKLEIPWNQQITRRWLPVDTYIGGQEHAVLHLLYSRFITMALNDLKLVDFDEPFTKFRAHGLITKGGAKMSKSKGNVVNPDDYYQKYGADALRMYLMFMGPFEQGGDWSDSGIIGIKRFLEKVWSLKQKTKNKKQKNTTENLKLGRLLHQTIKKVTEDLESLSYNTAISALMILVNEMAKEEKLQITNYKLLLLLLAPFAPYVAEELWHQLGNKDSIHNKSWPKYNPKLVKEEKITLIVQINGKVRDKIEAEAGMSEEEAKKLTLASGKVKQWIDGKEIKKVIFVAGKLINIVV